MLKRGVYQTTDAIVAITLLLAIMAGIILPLGNWLTDEYRVTIAADHAKRVKNAVTAFIKDNHDVIATQASSSSPYVFSVADLITAGYLPSGFSQSNNFSASYQTRVYQPVVNKFHTMTFLTGGVSLSKSLARKLAIRIGGEGGVIDGSEAKGALGAWTENLSAFGGYNPGDGSVVMAGFYDDGNVVNDYLYRKALPGHPELNTMSTSINMGGNDVTNANSVNAANVTASGWFRSTGDTGWYNEKHGGGLYMNDDTWMRVYNNKSIYTEGAVRAGTVQSDGRLTAKEYIQIEGIATAKAACTSNGLMGRNTAGAILVCKDLVWTENESSTLVSTATIANGSSFICKSGPSGRILVTGYANWLVSYGVYWMSANLYANGVLVATDNTAAFEYDHGRASGTSVTLFYVQATQPNTDATFSLTATDSYLQKVSYSCVGA